MAINTNQLKIERLNSAFNFLSSLRVCFLVHQFTMISCRHQWSADCDVIVAFDSGISFRGFFLLAFKRHFLLSADWVLTRSDMF